MERSGPEEHGCRELGIAAAEPSQTEKERGKRERARTDEGMGLERRASAIGAAEPECRLQEEARGKECHEEVGQAPLAQVGERQNQKNPAGRSLDQVHGVAFALPDVKTRCRSTPRFTSNGKQL